MSRKAYKIAWCHTGVTGGAKRATYDMVKELHRRGYEIDEYALCPKAVLDYLPLSNFVKKSYVHELGAIDKIDFSPYLLSVFASMFATWRRLTKLEDRFKKIAAEINAQGYDYVHIDHHPGAYTLGLLPYLNAKKVVYSHEASGVRYWGINDYANPKKLEQLTGSFLHDLYSRVCHWAEIQDRGMVENHSIRRMPKADLILANSEHTKEMLYQIYGQNSKTVYLGVDHEHFSPGHGDVKNYVLSVGRMVFPKQHPVIIEAVGRIKKENRPKVLIAAPEKETTSKLPVAIKNLAQEMGVDLEVHHLPSEEELLQLYREARAVVFVPLMEPFGLVPIEAMACGTPVIGVKEAGVRESVKDGVTGYLVCREPSGIAKAIEKLSDPTLREEMGNAARDYITKGWTWEVAMDAYIKEVDQLLRQ